MCVGMHACVRELMMDGAEVSSLSAPIVCSRALFFPLRRFVNML